MRHQQLTKQHWQRLGWRKYGIVPQNRQIIAALERLSANMGTTLTGSISCKSASPLRDLCLPRHSLARRRVSSVVENKARTIRKNFA